jgi:hypothetical protein
MDEASGDIACDALPIDEPVELVKPLDCPAGLRGGQRDESVTKGLQRAPDHRLKGRGRTFVEDGARRDELAHRDWMLKPQFNQSLRRNRTDLG